MHQLVHSLLCVLAFCVLARSFEDNDFYGIAYVQKTVYDLDKSVRFYTEVLDGMLIPEFRARNLQDDSHYYRMFQKEIIDARNRGVSVESLGVPDIRSNGRHRVSWDFVLFDNAMMWLIQFSDNFGNPFRRFDTSVGSAKTGFAHLAMVMDQNVNPYQMIQEIYKGEQDIGSEFAGFTSIVDADSFQQRNSIFPTNYDLFVTPESSGFRLANTRGTDGEKIEFSIRRGIANDPIFQGFCSVKAVHSAMLDSGVNMAASNKYKKTRVRTHGFHHISLTVPDMDQAVAFYTDVVRGGKNPQVTRKAKFPSFFRNLILQDDLLSAKEYNRALNEDFGWVDLLNTNPDSGSLDIGFINYDNFFLELYTFYPKDPANARRLEPSFSSPAYRNVLAPGFYLKDSVSMSSYISGLESRASSRGMNKVKANRAVDVNVMGQNVQQQDYSRPMTDGGLAGFDYTFVKGPGGEQFSIAQFKGASRQILQRSMKEYGSVSTAFTETNPYFWGGYNGVCGPTAPPPPPPAPAPAPAPGPGGRPEGTTRPSNVDPKGATTRPTRRP